MAVQRDAFEATLELLYDEHEARSRIMGLLDRVGWFIPLLMFGLEDSYPSLAVDSYAVSCTWACGTARAVCMEFYENGDIDGLRGVYRSVEEMKEDIKWALGKE